MVVPEGLQNTPRAAMRRQNAQNNGIWCLRCVGDIALELQRENCDNAGSLVSHTATYLSEIEHVESCLRTANVTAHANAFASERLGVG